MFLQASADRGTVGLVGFLRTALLRTALFRAAPSKRLFLTKITAIKETLVDTLAVSRQIGLRGGLTHRPFWAWGLRSTQLRGGLFCNSLCKALRETLSIASSKTFGVAFWSGLFLKTALRARGFLLKEGGFFGGFRVGFFKTALRCGCLFFWSVF